MKIKHFISVMSYVEYQWIIFIFGMFFGVFSTALQLIVPKIVIEIIDGFSITILPIKSCIFLVVLTFIAILSAIISGSLLAIFGQSSVKILRKRLWKQYLYLSVSTHSKLKTGEMVSRLTSDTSVLCEFLSVTFPN